MSVLDKFLNVIKLNDDEYDEEEYLDDEEELAEDVVAQDRFIKRRDEDDASDYSLGKRTSGLDGLDDTDTDSSSSKARSFTNSKKNSDSGKVSPIRPKKRGDVGGMKVCVIRPHSMEDSREITDALLNDCTVILNVEGLELDTAQRIIDFIAGSCYAMDGNLQKVSTYIFVITPASVDLSGDFQEIISDAFDVPFDR